MAERPDNRFSRLRTPGVGPEHFQEQRHPFPIARVMSDLWGSLFEHVRKKDWNRNPHGVRVLNIGGRGLLSLPWPQQGHGGRGGNAAVTSRDINSVSNIIL